MQKPLSLVIFAVLTLSACNNWSDSRANPSNWFGSSTSTPTEAPAYDPNVLVPPEREGTGLFSRPDPVDNSVPIARIDELRINPTPSGAIIYASGTAARQGAHGAQLVRVESEENQKNGVLEFTFRVSYPSYATNQGTERSRTVSDAANVSLDDLQNIRLVRVVGQQNTLESRRR